MQRTQGAALEWAVRSFGETAKNRQERAARFIEEALEVAQAEGLPLIVVEAIAERSYSRPPGEVGKEIGACMLTLEILAENAGVVVEDEANREWRRVKGKPKEWWAERHDAKIAEGIAADDQGFVITSFNSTFCCPKCGGHRFGTSGSDDWSNAIGSCNSQVKHEDGHYRRCTFTWPRSEDDRFAVFRLAKSEQPTEKGNTTDD